MKFYKGVRFKLAALYSVITVLTLSVFSVYQYESLWSEMLDNLDTRLRDEFLDFQRQFVPSQAAMKSYADVISKQNAKVPLQPALFVQFADATGKILARSDDSPESHPLASRDTFQRAVTEPLDQDPPGETETVTGRYEWPIRVLSARLKTEDGKDAVFQLGVSIRRLIFTTRGFAQNLALATVTLAALSLLIGWVMAKRSLRPVRDIIETTQAITAERLEERLSPVGSGDEIDDLIHTLNNMIGRLESAFKQISQFTADVSHELRTPLAVMRGEMEVALEYGKTVEDLKNVLMSSLEELDRLTVIANDLLLLARADAMMGTERFEQVNLRNLLSEVAGDMAVLAQSRGIDFKTGALPEATLLGDHDGLRRLFMNLLDNAVKYTASGGEVRLSCDLRDRMARVTVKDTGVGIAPEDLPHVFDRFYKASRSRMAGDDRGVGLGLSISKALAEQHGGKISVNSVQHQGTTFTVVLPVLLKTKGVSAAT
jgi:heavy metal sensor kinase